MAAYRSRYLCLLLCTLNSVCFSTYANQQILSKCFKFARFSHFSDILRPLTDKWQESYDDVLTCVIDSEVVIAVRSIYFVSLS